MPSSPPVRRRPAGELLGDLDCLFDDRRRNRIAMSLEAREVALDRLLHVPKSFPTCRTLRDAARQARTLRNEYAVLIWLDKDPILHGAQIIRRAASPGGGPVSRREAGGGTLAERSRSPNCAGAPGRSGACLLSPRAPPAGRREAGSPPGRLVRERADRRRAGACPAPTNRARRRAAATRGSGSRRRGEWPLHGGSARARRRCAASRAEIGRG